MKFREGNGVRGAHSFEVAKHGFLTVERVQGSFHCTTLPTPTHRVGEQSSTVGGTLDLDSQLVV